MRLSNNYLVGFIKLLFNLGTMGLGLRFSYIFSKIKLLFTFFFLIYYEFTVLFKKSLKFIDYITYILNLNFKRNRFFPQFKEKESQETIFNNSLGITSKYFSKKKSYLRGKSSYLLSAAYIRRFLVSLGLTKLLLEVVKIPKYFKEIIRVVTSNTNVLYNHPFGKNITVNEKANPIEIGFSYVFFNNNKPYSVVKIKKKGRLKRKISKKVKLLNNILD